MPAPPFSRREVLRTGALALAGGMLACRRRAAPAPPFDVCIVGSGFAGVYLGLALAEAGARVVVVEAGPRLGAADPQAGRADRLPVECAGDTGFAVDDTRTIGLGGTSRRWSGVLSRLAPADFRAGTRYGGGRADWPIAYEDLEPYYCRAESAMGVRGGRYLPAAEPPRACPYPFEIRRYVSPARLFPDRRLGFVPLPMSSRDGSVAALRLAEVEVPKLASYPGVALLVERTAIAVRDEGETAALVVQDAQGATEEIRASAVVIAAGVFETARLLLASRNERHPAGLGNRSGFLGSHFTVHPADRFEVPRGGSLKPPGGIHRTYAFAERLRQAGLGAAHADLHLQPESAMVEMMLETETAAANRFELDAAGRARLRFAFTERDRGTIAEAGKIGRGLLRAIAAEGARPTAQGRLWFHPAGLCRMAGDERGGVVDGDCRVFGTRNVYVAGAAVFPTAGSSNPTLTVVALSMRLADHLLGRLAGTSVLGRFGFPTR
jgi:glucose dehydrogenase